MRNKANKTDKMKKLLSQLSEEKLIELYKFVMALAGEQDISNEQ